MNRCICYKCDCECEPIGEYDGSFPRDLRCPRCGRIYSGDTFDLLEDVQ